MFDHSHLFNSLKHKINLNVIYKLTSYFITKIGWLKMYGEINRCLFWDHIQCVNNTQLFNVYSGNHIQICEQYKVL